jgi:vacuolar-type H+-ATPase subunit F/Vma7
MSAVAAIGEYERIAGFAFAGVQVCAADDPDAARAAWAALPNEVALLILTPAAHDALRELLDEHGRPLCAVLPT